MKIKRCVEKTNEIIEKIADFIMKYRYLIAAIALVLLVALKINFSSVDMWCHYMNEPQTKSTILGKARAIRSDEWLTQSATMLGQSMNEDGYGVHNKNIAQGTSNMLMVSAPVTDIVAISRPLTWGFLLFGTEYGFSFYWVLKMIALLMVSIELVKKVTHNNNLLALIGGIVLGLAPAMMWWLSTAVVDGYIYGAAVIVLFGYYMQNLDWKLWKKLLIALGIIICLPGFAFMLYPAFQVPFAFLMAIFMLNDLIKNWKNLKKQDFILMGITIVASLALIVRFILLSLDDIKVMMGTVYPGARVEKGGNFTIDNFISYFANIFFPYTNRIANTCEPSTYIYSFTGLMILIVLYLGEIKEEKNKKDFGLIIGLIALYAIYLIWEFVGFKTILAKITLMYFSPAQRTHVVLGIIGTLLSIIMIQKVEGKNKISKVQGIVISSIVVVLSYVLIKQSSYNEFFTTIKYEILLPIVFLITYFLIRGNVKAWSYTMCVVAVISGAIVNPIVRGIAPINKTDISKEIKQIYNEDKEALWIGENNFNGQYLIANGVNCLNGVNTYPNFKWLDIVDPEKQYNEVYNRFAHIGIKLSDTTKFELLGADSYVAYLTYEDLKNLNVKYYFSYSKMEDNIVQEFKLETIFSNAERCQYIYQIN